MTIRYVEELPPVEQATAGLRLGEQMSLEEAREQTLASRSRCRRSTGSTTRRRSTTTRQSSQVAFLYGSEEAKLLITQADVRGAIEKLS